MSGNRPTNGELPARWKYRVVDEPDLINLLEGTDHPEERHVLENVETTARREPVPVVASRSGGFLHTVAALFFVAFAVTALLAIYTVVIPFWLLMRLRGASARRPVTTVVPLPDAHPMPPPVRPRPGPPEGPARGGGSR